MAEVKIRSHLLESGMELARDVSKEGILLIKKDTELNGKLIKQLIYNDIPMVWIYEESRSEHFQAYQENYNNFADVVKLVREDQPVELKLVKPIIDNFNEVNSHQSLLSYIYGIRRFDQYTYNHSLNVSYLALMLGKWSNYPDNEMLALAGVLHDVGKVKIKNNILNKPGPLTDMEWEEMKKHPYLGYKVVEKSPGMPQDVLPGVLYHHERVDGSGYPEGLAGEEIPELARIIAIVDVFDALTSRRVYREKKDVFEVLQFMHDKYHEFDLKYLRIFTENMLDFLVGEKVLLSDDRLGKIVFKNPIKPFAPLIQTDDGFVDLSKEKDIKIAKVLTER